MKILALDLATRTGWAHSDGPSGVWDFSIRRDESGGMRLVRFRAKLREMLAKAPFAVVVYEAARHAAPGRQGALVVQAELQGVLKQWCESEQIDYRGYSPAEIKRHATGNGRASKEVMLETARLKWSDRVIQDDNEADALFLLDLAETDLD